MATPQSAQTEGVWDMAIEQIDGNLTKDGMVGRTGREVGG